MSRYLIITSDALKPCLTNLIAQKESRGFGVKLLSANTLISDPEKLRNYVLRYLPDYLLLVGDHDTVPPYPLHDGTIPYGSDAYFSMPDDAIVPTVPTGRLSTSDPSVLTTVVNTLLAYPTGKTIWWKRRALLTGWIPRGPEELDTPEGKEDAGWNCVQEIGSYYDIIMQFENNRSDPNITEARKKQWQVAQSSKSALKASIESGVAIIRYLGHGTPGEWVNIGIRDQSQAIDESFGVSDVQSLNIVNGLPLVLSVACSTGQISASPSFAEAWQIYGKAIGIFASDVIESGFWHDRFTQCFFHSLVTMQRRRVGDALIDAMKLLNAVFPWVEKPNYTKFRYLGDPDTIIAAPEDDGKLDCRRCVITFSNLKGDSKVVAQEQVEFPTRVRRAYPVLNGFDLGFGGNAEHPLAKLQANLLSRAADIKIDNTKVSMSVEVSLRDKNKDDAYGGHVDAMIFALLDP